MKSNRELYKIFGGIYGIVGTKKEGIEFIRRKLFTDDVWLMRGLLAIYKRQTDSERRLLESVENNGVGFSKYDAARMSKYASVVCNGRCLTITETHVLRITMLKYSEQLYNMSIDTLRSKYE